MVDTRLPGPGRRHLPYFTALCPITEAKHGPVK
jgi:hypothetical protein